MADNGGLILVVAFLLIFGGIITLNDSSSTGSTLPQCSDGIDNDGDNYTDSADGKCLWATDATPPQTPTFFYCPNHDDETTTPTYSTQQEAENAGCEQI